MGLIQTNNTGSGGGGGEQQRWQRDTLAQTAAWTAGGLSIALTQSPTDADGIIVWSQGQPLYPTDYTYSAGVITINFAADPATDTDDGTWNFLVQYPYTL